LNYRITQVGGDFGRSSVQPPAQSRVNTEFRPRCSGLSLSGSQGLVSYWKHPRKEIPQPLVATCCIVSLSSVFTVGTATVSVYDRCLSPTVHLNKEPGFAFSCR